MDSLAKDARGAGRADTAISSPRDRSARRTPAQRRTPSRAAPARLERAHVWDRTSIHVPSPDRARDGARLPRGDLGRVPAPADLARARPRQKTNRGANQTVSAAMRPPGDRRARCFIAPAPANERRARAGNRPRRRTREPARGTPRSLAVNTRRRRRRWRRRRRRVARFFASAPRTDARAGRRERVRGVPATRRRDAPSPRARQGRERSPRRATRPPRRAAIAQGREKKEGWSRAARPRASRRNVSRVSLENSSPPPPLLPSPSRPPKFIALLRLPRASSLTTIRSHSFIDASQGDNSKFYDALGVAKNADAAEIKKAYRKAAIKNHRQGRRPREVQGGHRGVRGVVRPREARDLRHVRRGGSQGRPWRRPGGGSQDIFEAMFGVVNCDSARRRRRSRRSLAPAQGRGRRPRPQGVPRGSVQRRDEEALAGQERPLPQVRREGLQVGRERGRGTCKGSGVRVVVRQIAPGMVQQMQTVCNDCRGSGQVISEKDNAASAAARRWCRRRRSSRCTSRRAW